MISVSICLFFFLFSIFVRHLRLENHYIHIWKPWFGRKEDDPFPSHRRVQRPLRVTTVTVNETKHTKRWSSFSCHNKQTKTRISREGNALVRRFVRRLSSIMMQIRPSALVYMVQYFRFKTFQTRALFWKATHKSTTVTICFSESPFLLVLLVRVSSWSDQLVNLKLKLHILQIFYFSLAASVA